MKTYTDLIDNADNNQKENQTQEKKTNRFFIKRNNNSVNKKRAIKKVYTLYKNVYTNKKLLISKKSKKYLLKNKLLKIAESPDKW